MPTAMRIASIRGLRSLVEVLRELETSLAKKAIDTGKSVKEIIEEEPNGEK
jgi:aspartate ammonia-lyase